MNTIDAPRCTCAGCACGERCRLSPAAYNAIAFEFFYASASPFSQWHPCEFADEDVAFTSAEQYMMYHKALMFRDAHTAAAILHTSDCGRIKRLGRNVANFNEAAWNARADDVVFRGNMLKFGQNQSLRAALMATGTRTLVEASPSDAIWGIGMTARDARNKPHSYWPGQNRLGKVLTRVRAALSSVPITRPDGTSAQIESRPVFFPDGTLVQPDSGLADISRMIDRKCCPTLAGVHPAHIPEVGQADHNLRD